MHPSGDYRTQGYTTHQQRRLFVCVTNCLHEHDYMSTLPAAWAWSMALLAVSTAVNASKARANQPIDIVLIDMASDIRIQTTSALLAQLRLVCVWLTCD